MYFPTWRQQILNNKNKRNVFLLGLYSAASKSSCLFSEETNYDGKFYAFPTVVLKWNFLDDFPDLNWFQLTNAEEKLDYEEVEDEEEDELLSGRNQLSLNLWQRLIPPGH